MVVKGITVVVFSGFYTAPRVKVADGEKRLMVMHKGSELAMPGQDKIPGVTIVGAFVIR